jgi:hypothetical protein
MGWGMLACCYQIGRSPYQERATAPAIHHVATAGRQEPGDD